MSRYHEEFWRDKKIIATLVEVLWRGLMVLWCAAMLAGEPKWSFVPLSAAFLVTLSAIVSHLPPAPKTGSP